MTTAQHLFQARYGDDSLPPPAVWSPVPQSSLRVFGEGPAAESIRTGA